MIPNLPRPLLWTEIKTMDEFLKGERFAELLYKNLHWLKKYHSLPVLDELVFFNELYYQLTRYYYEKPKLEDYPRYVADIKKSIGHECYVDLLLTMMFHYCRLQNSSIELLLTDRFLQAIVNNQYKNKYWGHFLRVEPQSFGWKKYVLYPQKPCPVSPASLIKKGLNWKRITHEFNLETLKEILSLWEKEDDKKNIASILIHYVITIKEYNSEKIKNVLRYLTQVMNGQDNNHDEKTFSANIVELEGPVMFNSEYNKSKESEKEILQLKNDIKNYRQRIERLEKKNKELEEELVKAKELDKKRIEEIDKWHGSYEDSCKASDVWQAQYEEAEDKIKIAEHEKKESEKLKQENVELRVKIAQLQSQLEEEKTNLKTCVSTSQLKLTNNSNFARVVQAMVSARYFKRANGDETNATEVGSMLLKLFGVSNTWKSVLQKAFSRENPLKTFDDLRDAGANYWANRSGLTEDIRKKGKK